MKKKILINEQKEQRVKFMKTKKKFLKNLESVVKTQTSTRIQFDSSEDAYRQINKISFGQNFKVLIGNFKSENIVSQSNQSRLL